MDELFEVAIRPKGHKDNEWFTPAAYVEAARRVMGSIDLDPASCEDANKTVKAERFYSQKENGLAHTWSGNIWLNPPFNKISGRSGISRWAKKLLEAYETGEIEQAILLVPAQTGSKWFTQMWNYPVCFANHHLRFFRPGMMPRSQRDCTCFIYLGTNEAKFIEVFSQFGTIVKRVSLPQPKIQSELWSA